MKINPSKVKKISKILRVVMNVFFWATIVVRMIFVIAWFVIIFAPSDILNLLKTGSMSLLLDFNGIASYNVDPSMYEATKLKPVFLALIPTVVLGASMLAIILRQVSSILRTVEKDCPFEEKNSKRLTIIGVILIIGSIIFNAAQCAIVAAMIENFQISNLDVKYSFDGTMLTTGFLILILAGVFKYGNFLQKEYDATL